MTTARGRGDGTGWDILCHSFRTLVCSGSSRKLPDAQNPKSSLTAQNLTLSKRQTSVCPAGPTPSPSGPPALQAPGGQDARVWRAHGSQILYGPSA